MPVVRVTIAAVKVAIVRIDVTFSRAWTFRDIIGLIGNAMGPRVIRTDGDSASAALNRKQHAVITARSAVIVLIQSADFRSVSRPLERQLAARVGVIHGG